MGKAWTIIFWCDACAVEDWEQVGTWVWDGKAVVRSGVLKAAARCRSCDEELPIGTHVEAIALDFDEPEGVRVLREFITTDAERRN